MDSQAERCSTKVSFMTGRQKFLRSLC